VIDRLYTLDEIVEAHRYVDLGHKKGNVIVTSHHADRGGIEPCQTAETHARLY